MPQRVLVTGGAGTIGTAVVRRLLRDADWEVRVSDQRTPPQWMRESCQVHTGDLREVSEARAATDGCSHVIHLAAIVGGIGNFHKLPHTLLEVNTGLYNGVFRAALDERVQRLVYVSSSMRTSPTRRSRSRPTASRSSPARSTAARCTTSTACRTRSAARSTPTDRARCLTTSRASRTRCPT
jgi:nucleoside-diphosphate-sugar epimerase